MFTSRAEFRLHLRIDNADNRLTPHGRTLGLIDDPAWTAFQAKQARLATLTTLLETTKLTEDDLLTLEAGTEDESQPLTRGDKPAQLLKRPNLTIEFLLPILLPHMHTLPELTPWVAALQAANPQLSTRIPNLSSLVPAFILPAWVRNELKTVETTIKFAGYLAQQQKSIDRLKRDEGRPIPSWFDYTNVSGLSREMVEKLSRVRPGTLGQASRMPGVTPAALNLIQCFLEIQARGRTA